MFEHALKLPQPAMNSFDEPIVGKLTFTEYPLSPNQEGLWALEQRFPGRGLYNANAVWRLPADISPSVLRRALGRVWARHPAWHTTFSQRDGAPFQVVHDDLPMDFREVTVADGGKADLEAILEEQASQFLNLEQGPPVRWVVISIPGEAPVLLLQVHRIIADGWSLTTMLTELGELYREEAGGPPADLPPPKRTYSQFIQERTDWQGSPDAERQKRFWQETLSGQLPLLDLPTDRPRGVSPSFKTNCLPFAIPTALREGMRKLARDAGVRPLAPWLSAWFVFLYRLTGQEDLVTTIPATGRGKEYDGVLGFFENTVPVRIRCSGKETFRTFVKHTADALEPALTHGDWPFSLMVEGADKDTLSALSQTSFFWQDHSPLGERHSSLPKTQLVTASGNTGEIWHVGDMEWELLRYWQQPREADIQLSLTNLPDNQYGILQYASDLFDRSTIERWSGHFLRLLEGIVAEPETRISRLPLLSEAERRQILVEWNATGAPYPQDKCVHELFEAQAAKTPDAVAVVFGEEEVSYGELNTRANRLAHRLRKLGIGPEVLVGLFVERSVEMVVGLLAILKAGGAYVPLDPAYPEERLAFMAEDADLKVLLCHGETKERVPEYASYILDMDAEAAAIAGESAENPAPHAGASSLAYVIYTSGSTGKPKGVMIEHGNLYHSNFARQTYYGFTGLETFLLLSPVSFDSSVAGIFGTLTQGATLALPEKEIDVSTLAGLVTKYRITHLLCTPTLYSAVLSQPDRAGLSSLKAATIAGESNSQNLLAEHYAVLPNTGLFNEYGPTEATVWSSVHLFEDPQDKPGCIGKPIANTRIYILDPNLQPVPIGVPGELHVGGAGVARGYLNHPDLTFDKFIPDPFSDEAGNDGDARLYRTGDLCRWLPDGNIEFLDRIDNQVKIRGFRIECGEVENALLSHPRVREAVVDVRGEGTDKQLVAWVIGTDDVVGATGGSPLRDELRAHLRASLPDWMIPARFVFVDALPLTPGGKIDRRALIAPDAAIDGGNYEPPRNADERQLATIWSEVLKRPDIGIHDNFFDLGGDSILNIQIVSRARQAGLGLNTRNVFEHQTIAELAQTIQPIGQVSAEQGPIQGEVPLTPIQSRFFNGDSTELWHFNQAVLLETPPNVEESALERALVVVLKHHDVFRLRYRLEEGAWQSHVVTVSSDETLPFHVESLSGLDELEQRADHWQASLDLQQGPLTRLVLFRTEIDAKLLWVIHHLIVDGVSWRILIEDLQNAYNAVKMDGTPKLPAKTSSFKLWSERLREWRESNAFAAEANWWRQLPQPEVSLPVDHPGGPNRVADTCHHTLTFDADVTRALLIDSPSAYHTGINDLLLAALLLALRDWTGQRGHIIDLESHGRADLFDDVDLSRTVGWFTALYTVALELPAGGDLGDVIKTIKEQLRKVPFDGVGYGVLRQQGEKLPQGEIVFNYLGQFDQVGQQDGFRLSRKAGQDGFLLAREAAGRSTSLTGSRDHLIDINGASVHDRLSFTFSYSEKQYREATIRILAEGYRNHLEGLIGHCREHYGYTLSDFPLAALTQARLDALTRDYGRDIAAVYPLSPMQQGMLFHTLHDPESGQYFEQFHYRLQGDVDTRMLREAWQVLVDRHSILRTAFHYGRDNPAQIVLKHTEVPWTEYDWREFTQEERLQKRDTLLEAERRRGFDFTQAPLMRFQLIREAPDSWRLLWQFHHVLMDGWCSPILFGELFQVYTALRRRETPRLAPVNRYQNYIAWLVAQDREIAKDYWREKLSGFQSPTAIPLIRNRDRQTPDYRETKLTLSREKTQQLERFAREQRVTLNTLVQAAWAILLGRYSAEEDVVFGVTTSGRNVPVPGIETMVGLFINTLPLRVRLEGVLSTLLHAIQDQQQQDNQYAYTSLADIQSWSEIPGGMALFDSILVFENYPMGDALKNQDSLPFQVTDFQAIEYTNYPITLAMALDESLAFKLTFDQNRVAPDAIDRLFGQLKVLFDAMVQGLESDIHRLPILTEAERHRILVEWNATEAPYPQNKCVHELFEAQVARDPDAVAVIFEEEEVSYGELNARANRLAHRLRKLGVGPEVLVGLFVERSMEMVVGILAILKAGGAYVPLDPEYPVERLTFMAEDAGLMVLLCHGATRDRVPECAARILELDGEAEAIAGENSENPARLAEGNNLAYVIYTSGSTGKPKGVCVEHRNIIRLFRTTEDTYHFGSHDVWTLFHSHAFDFSVWEIWGALFYGGTLIVVPYMTTRTPELFYELLIEKGVTVLNQTPSAFYQLIQHEETLSPDTTKSLALRWVIFGGEALNPTKLEPWFERHGDTVPVLVNMYGITETTVHVTWHPLKSGEVGDAASNIGVPIPDLRAYILDSWQQPVPIGIAGELYVGGAGVARGYLDRPDLTAERFIPDPFSDDPDARLYRTGDLCRWLPDGNMAKGNIAKGNIEYLGRIDTQVKIRGFRIELGEVENALLSHPSVREAVVDARGEETDKQLVVWLVGADDVVGATSGSPLRDELRTHLRASLPDWMVPARFVFVDALPLTPSGKIDRRALPAPGQEDLIKKEYVAPRGSAEGIIAGIWAELLGMEQVGVLDNFFDLGGHSLLIVQAHSRLQEHFTQASTITELFQYPTVRALAKFLKRQDGDGGDPSEAFREAVENQVARRRAALGRGLISR